MGSRVYSIMLSTFLSSTALFGSSMIRGAMTLALSRGFVTNTEPPSSSLDHVDAKLPREVILHGGPKIMGCTPSFFKEWIDFQLESRGLELTWEELGLEWDFVRLSADDSASIPEERAFYWTRFCPARRGSWAAPNPELASRLVREFLASRVGQN